MKDDALKKYLRTLPVPEPEAAARDRALYRSLTALRHAEGGKRDAAIAKSPVALWPWIAAALCLTALVWVSLSRLDHSTPPEDSLVLSKTLHEMETLFPGQLNAVIEHDGDVELDLAAQSAPPSEQPVLLEFSKGTHVLRVLSYSGRRVCVNLGGARTCLEPLVTGDGKVILTGDDFLWDSQNPMSRAGYHVAARFLNPAS